MLECWSDGAGLESDWENVLRATRGGTGVIRRPNAVFTEGLCGFRADPQADPQGDPGEQG